MVFKNFSFSRVPHLHFGVGQFNQLIEILEAKFKRVLLITGGKSFRATKNWQELTNSLCQNSIQVFDTSISGEPSPNQVDQAVSEFSRKEVDVVVAIGGGSVIDDGKAISAMLPLGTSVVDYLEGVGNKPHPGNKILLIAVPTTAGTGSEATKNAVLSNIGKTGFKKSLRHENFVPEVAIIDPELFVKCPLEVTAACGLDAFTQLLESYVSTAASPMTDALAWDGLEKIIQSLIKIAKGESKDLQGWSDLAYSAWPSGITLANAGLGIVHGLASPVGGYFAVSHGVFCGTMIAAATEMNIEKLENSEDPESMALSKYAKVGQLMSGTTAENLSDGCRYLVDSLNDWIQQLKIPRLGKFGISERDLEKIVEAAGNKNNPVKLFKDQIIQLLKKRL